MRLLRNACLREKTAGESHNASVDDMAMTYGNTSILKRIAIVLGRIDETGETPVKGEWRALICTAGVR